MRAVESQRLIQQVNCLPKVVPLLVLLSNRRSDCRILAFMSRVQPTSCSDFLLLPGYLAFALAFSATASAVLSSVNMTCKRHKYLLVAHHDSSFLFSSLLQGQRWAKLRLFDSLRVKWQKSIFAETFIRSTWGSFIRRCGPWSNKVFRTHSDVIGLTLLPIDVSFSFIESTGLDPVVKGKYLYVAFAAPAGTCTHSTQEQVKSCRLIASCRVVGPSSVRVN